MWNARRPVFGAAALVCLVALAPPAMAQKDKGPLSLLKPWIEKQIFGKSASGAVEPAAGATPDEESPADATASDSGETDAAAPDAAGEPSPSDAASDAPLEDANGAPLLRGTTEPEDAASGADTAALPDVPEDAAATDEPPPESDVPPAVAEKPEPLRFAVLAGRSATATMAVVGPIADDLAALLDRPVEFLPLPSFEAMIDAQIERRIDGGFYSAASFAVADSRCGCIEPLVAPRAWDGTLAYHAIIVARVGAGIGSVADLAGKTVAVGAEDSIGARRMQIAGLMAEGFDPSAFGSVVEVDSAEEAVRRVAAGRADAAFAWSSLAGRVEDGYSRGTLTDLVHAGEIAMGRIAIVWRSPAIEHGPFALLRTIDEADKAKIQSYLVALMTAKPAAYDGLNPFYGGGYAPVDPADYAGLAILVAQDAGRSRTPGASAEATLNAAPPDPSEATAPPPAE